MQEYRDIASGSSSVDATAFERYSNVAGFEIPFEDEVSGGRGGARAAPTDGLVYVSHRQFHLVDHQRHDHEQAQGGCVARCGCTDGCESGDCPCADHDGQVAFRGGRLHRRRPYPLDCCGARCACAHGAMCGNRPRLALPEGLTVCREAKYGPGCHWAVRAKAPIEHGTWVCEYVGDLLHSQAEIAAKAAAHLAAGVAGGTSYMVLVDAAGGGGGGGGGGEQEEEEEQEEEGSDTEEGDSALAIDATVRGGLARFLNHSCDPNLFTQQVTVCSVVCCLFCSVLLFWCLFCSAVLVSVLVPAVSVMKIVQGWPKLRDLAQHLY
jgi:hypothetical protein